MNARQRRTTYRRLRKLMLEKTPVRFRLTPGEYVTGLVEFIYCLQGRAVVRDLQGYFKAQLRSVHHIKPMPRCWRV